MILHPPLNPLTGAEDASMLPWVAGNPATGAEGSYPGVGVFTDPQQEIVNVILDSGLVPGADLDQLSKAIARLIAAAIANITFPQPTIYGVTPAGGLALTANNFKLAFQSLIEDDSPVGTDFVAYLRGADGVHVKTSFQTFAQAIIAFLPASLAPVTPAANYAPFSFPSTQNLGNAVTTTISFAGMNTPWGSGNGSGFTFTKQGIYTIDFQIVLNVATTYSNSGSSASNARFYTTAQIFKNGQPLAIDPQQGTAANYVGTATTFCSCTAVFVPGDVISIAGEGTGDQSTSGGCILVSPSYVNITYER